MLANNETGVLNPIKEISELIVDKDILLHSDIVQAFGKVEIDVKELGLAFASVSAHKNRGSALTCLDFYMENCVVTYFRRGQENVSPGTSAY